MKQYLTYIAVLPILISCETQIGNEVPAAYYNLLTSRPWKRVASTAQRQGMKEEDTWTDQLPCVKDDLYTFKINQTYATDQGATKCFAEDAQQESKARWNISADGKILMITESEDFGGAEFPYEIEKLDANTLKLKRVLDKFTVTETYAH